MAILLGANKLVLVLVSETDTKRTEVWLSSPRRGARLHAKDAEQDTANERWPGKKKGFPKALTKTTN